MKSSIPQKAKTLSYTYHRLLGTGSARLHNLYDYSFAGFIAFEFYVQRNRNVCWASKLR